MYNLWRHFKDSLWAVKADTELIQAHLRAMDGHPEVVTNHPRAVKSQAGAMKFYTGVVISPWSQKGLPWSHGSLPWGCRCSRGSTKRPEVHHGAEKVHPRPIEADPGVKDVPNGAVEGHTELGRHWA
jgi:hypothetical protein